VSEFVCYEKHTSLIRYIDPSKGNQIICVYIYIPQPDALSSRIDTGCAYAQDELLQGTFWRYRTIFYVRD